MGISEECQKSKAEYELRMLQAMQKIAKSCGKTFAVDIGYQDLPDLVESLVNPKPKEQEDQYVRVKSDFCDFLKDLHDSVPIDRYVLDLDGREYPALSLGLGVIMQNKQSIYIYRAATQEELHQKEAEELAIELYSQGGLAPDWFSEDSHEAAKDEYRKLATYTLDNFTRKEKAGKSQLHDDDDNYAYDMLDDIAP